MKQKRLKNEILKSIILTLCLTIIACLSVVTFAWFTDKKEYTGNLTFGSIELDVAGGVDNETKTLKFSNSRENDATWTGKIMPGDTVNINLTVGLKDGSEPAYYMVFIADKNGYFENAAYYGIKDSSNNLNTYKSDGRKVVLQSSGAEETGVSVGKLLAGTANAHNLTISAKIKENLTIQKVTTEINCKIVAIQQANLSDSEANTKLNLSFGENILSFEGRTVVTNTGLINNTSPRNLTGNQIFVGLSSNNYFYGANINSYEIDNPNNLTVNTKSVPYGIGLDFLCNPSEKYILCWESLDDGQGVGCGWYSKDGDYQSFMGLSYVSSGGKSVVNPITIPAETEKFTIVFCPKSGTDVHYNNIKLVKLF